MTREIRSKSTKIEKNVFFPFLEGTDQKMGQKSVQNFGIPDDVSGFGNFETRFWTFSQRQRRFSWISKKLDLYKTQITLRLSKKTSIFDDFFHFHDQKSKKDHFRLLMPGTEHYFTDFTQIFLNIMHMYRLHFVLRFGSNFTGHFMWEKIKGFELSSIFSHIIWGLPYWDLSVFIYS